MKARETLMINLLKIMADQRLDAIVQQKNIPRPRWTDEPRNNALGSRRNSIHRATCPRDDGLPAPPPGYHWIRFGPDALLVRYGDGYVLDGAYGIFY